ncbi:MAG: EAL domain-containing protein [Tyzzerella sp.]|nr:EAL domain-containing protein [Tyzzerella sp.]
MKKYIATLIFSLLFGLTTLTTLAALNTTTNSTAGDNIYIAGNPDFYPFEYYDEKSKTYEGILPAFYEQLSEQTGIELTYICAGEKNQQKRLVANKQVELVSAFTEEMSDLAESHTVFTYEKDGEKISVNIGFTEIMPEETKSVILDKLKKKTTDEWLSSTLAVSSAPEKISPWIWYLLGNVLVLGVIALSLSVVGRRRRKAIEETKKTDSLTGIGNVEYLKYAYEHYLPESMYYLYYATYIALNSENFEKYLGTSELDETQQYAANILSTDIGDNDFVARIDSGVFVLFFQGVDEQRATERIEELLRKLNNNSKNFFFRAGLYHLGKAKQSLESIIYNARQGYNYAAEKRQLYCITNKDILDHTAFQARLRKRLIDAVDNDEFEMFLQFIVNQEGAIIGAEALSRWNNKEEGLLAPGHYIADMMNLNLIDRLDFCILEKACKQLAEWNRSEYQHLSISCNFTRITVSMPDFLSRFHAVVDKYTFDHKRLIIELTEDSLADNMALAYQNILACKKKGFRIALDDMGSGYSSLSDLCDYPIDVIKIDRHIVAKSSSYRANLLLRGLVTLAHELGIQVLCEGVETADENQRVIDNGCDYIQGFYYSRVLPKENAMDYYDNYMKKRTT